MTTIDELQQENARLRTELARQQATLQAVIEAMPAVVYIRDPAGVFQQVNHAHADVLGMEPQAITGKRDADLFPADLVAGFRETDQQALEADAVSETEDYVPQADGVHTYRSIKFPIRGEDGTLIGIGGISIDITEQEEHARLLQSLLDNSPMVIYVKDEHGRYILFNRQVEQALNQSREEIVGKTDYDLFPPELAKNIQAHDARVLAEGQAIDIEDVIRQGGEQRIYHNIKFPLHDAQGRVYAVGAFAFDITAQKQAEIERASLQQQVIDAQRDALRELSTPLLPIMPGVLIMPLVGTMDSQRAQMVMEFLLNGVAQHQANLAIIDITGVQVVDTQVAQALIQVAQAVRLLGAQVVLTGIQPQIAQTLVHLGANLEGIRTYGTLQSGIAVVLNQM
ncbi:MAG: PAS domain-containing protein [Chloroflexaceae bacterium]